MDYQSQGRKHVADHVWSFDHADHLDVLEIHIPNDTWALYG